MSLPKKIFIISTSLLALVLIFWGVYYLAFRETAPKTVTKKEDSKKSIEEEQPKEIKSDILPITDEAVLGATISERGTNIKYYSKATGKTYQIDFDGQKKKSLSTDELLGLIDVIWSPAKTRVLSKFISGSDVHYSFYDYVESRGVALPESVTAAVWQNDNKIIYFYHDKVSGKKILSIADPDGKNWSNITEVGKGEFLAAPIPKSGLISFWNSPDAYTETILQSITAIGGEKKTILSGKFGADYLWSPNGENILVSYLNEKGSAGIQLAVTNNKGGELKNLGIPTWVSKCVWSKDGESVYYALPGLIPEASVLPNDYDQGKFTTQDTFWKVNIKTGKKERFVDLEKTNGKFDATKLFLNESETQLFFINKIDGKLYKIDI